MKGLQRSCESYTDIKYLSSLSLKVEKTKIRKNNKKSTKVFGLYSKHKFYVEIQRERERKKERDRERVER